MGGGLAGLTMSIQLADLGYRVVLLEKEQYPFHKVCGEYISLESWDFLSSLGLDLEALQVSKITRLEVTTTGTAKLEQTLPLGGFGISRYRLDQSLVTIARNKGVEVREATKVIDVRFGEDEFMVDCGSDAIRARVACGAFGKRANLDVKWKRGFIASTKKSLNNYVGVKYHVSGDFPRDTISLHTFEGGYCGLVRIEDDRYCLCYLTKASNLQKSGNSIMEMERQILSANPSLRLILQQCVKLYDAPLTISQISFDQKKQVEDHKLMIGDAAGMITPLCGNGMSMAMHAGKIAVKHIDSFLRNQGSREEMEQGYTIEWNTTFAKRLATGRRIQSMFGRRWLTGLLVGITSRIPLLTKWLIRQTHGRAF